MQYKMVVVVHPKEDEKKFSDKLSTLLEKEGFTVAQKNSWGKKKLAYPIQKQAEGIYLDWVIEAPVSTPQRLYAQFKQDDSIMRTLILRKEVEKKPKTKDLKV